MKGVAVQFLSHVQLFVTPWTAAHQAAPSSLYTRVCSKVTFIIYYSKYAVALCLKKCTYQLKNTSSICNIGSQWEFALWLRELKLGLGNNLEGWYGEGGRGNVQVGGDMCIPMADSCWCLIETNAILLSNYPSIKNKFKKYFIAKKWC